MRVKFSHLLPALIFSASALHAEGVFDSIGQEVHAIFERSRDSIVRIEAEDEHGKLAGTGFFIDTSGTLYTSYSIGGATTGIVVTRGGRPYHATRILGDSRSGVAILKIEAQTPFLPLGHATELQVASPVVAIGFPMDLPLSPNFGMVAGFDSKYQGRYLSTRHIRANIPVHRGQAGAPLLNLKGEVVGILISRLENNASCFALPIEAAEKVRRDVQRFGEVRPGWLGLAVEELPRAVAPGVVRISSLIPGSPAEGSGIAPGDVLLEIGGRKIKSPEDVINAAFFLTAGEQAAIVIEHDGEVRTHDILAAQFPSSTGPLQALGSGTPQEK